MSTPFERKYNTLEQIVQKTAVRVVCPQCLRGFSRADLLYSHFRAETDDIHQGLAARKSDFDTFLSCYQKSLKCLMLAENLPQGQACFDISFVVENYGKDPEIHKV
jgi:hypothetical protein